LAIFLKWTKSPSLRRKAVNNLKKSYVLGLVAKAVFANNIAKGSNITGNNIGLAMQGYFGKECLVTQAIVACVNLNARDFQVSWNIDNNHIVIFFDIANFGQCSFHMVNFSTRMAKKLTKQRNPRGVWNGILGGSLATAVKISKSLNMGTKIKV
jgi:hypothetical protein